MQDKKSAIRLENNSKFSSFKFTNQIKTACLFVTDIVSQGDLEI